MARPKKLRVDTPEAQRAMAIKLAKILNRYNGSWDAAEDELSEQFPVSIRTIQRFARHELDSKCFFYPKGESPVLATLIDDHGGNQRS